APGRQARTSRGPACLLVPSVLRGLRRPMTGGAQPKPIRSFLFRRRRWQIALGIVLALRIALPEVLRRVIRSQVSQRLRTRVEVGDVDLALYRGGGALKDFALYSARCRSP